MDEVTDTDSNAVAFEDPYAAYRQDFYSQVGERFETFEAMRRLGGAFVKEPGVAPVPTSAGGDSWTAPPARCPGSAPVTN